MPQCSSRDDEIEIEEKSMFFEDRFQTLRLKSIFETPQDQGRNRVVVRYGISVPFFWGAEGAPSKLFVFLRKLERYREKLRNVHN